MVLNILTLAISFHALGFNWLLQTLLTWHAGELCFVTQWAESSLSGKIYALQYNQGLCCINPSLHICNGSRSSTLTMLLLSVWQYNEITQCAFLVSSEFSENIKVEIFCHFSLLLVTSWSSFWGWAGYSTLFVHRVSDFCHTTGLSYSIFIIVKFSLKCLTLLI